MRRAETSMYLPGTHLTLPRSSTQATRTALSDGTWRIRPCSARFIFHAEPMREMSGATLTASRLDVPDEAQRRQRGMASSGEQWAQVYWAWYAPLWWGSLFRLRRLGCSAVGKKRASPVEMAEGEWNQAWPSGSASCANTAFKNGAALFNGSCQHISSEWRGHQAQCLLLGWIALVWRPLSRSVTVFEHQQGTSTFFSRRHNDGNLRLAALRWHRLDLCTHPRPPVASGRRCTSMCEIRPVADGKLWAARFRRRLPTGSPRILCAPPPPARRAFRFRLASPF